MQQLKQILMTLALLMTAATGAWATDVYVAGNGGDVSGGKWCNGQTWSADAAANKMTEQNGIYSITFTGLPAYSDYEFKFALNGTWSTSYGYSSTTVIELNKTFSVIEASGENTNAKFSLTETADVTISFNLSELTFMISTSGMKAGDDAAPATYAVDLKANTDDASNWTGKAGSATEFSALPIEGVAEGDAVTLKYSGNRKVKTVTATLLQMQSLTVAKGSSGLSGDKVLYYMPGDTYRQALARTENQSEGGLGWGYWEDSSITTLFFKEVTTKAWDVAIDGDSNFGPGKGSCNITFDTEIDPTGHTFEFVNSQ